MRRSDQLPGTIERAADFDRFCRGCEARGLKVKIALVLHPRLTGKHELDPKLQVVVEAVDGDRKPFRLGEVVHGDIRDTVRVLALQIGLRPKLA